MSGLEPRFGCETDDLGTAEKWAAVSGLDLRFDGETDDLGTGGEWAR